MKERKTIDLKKFRFLNGVSQSQLAAYLGVGQSFISKMESQGYPMPQEIYDKIMAHPEWSLNIDAITKSTATAGDHIEIKGGRGNIGKTSGEQAKITCLEKENEILKAQIEELKKEKAEYWQMIQNLSTR